MSSLLHPPVPTAAIRRLRWHQLYGSAAALALAEATQLDRRLYVVIADAARVSSSGSRPSCDSSSASRCRC